MKIAIYANELNKESESGVKVYTREIIKALLKHDSRNTYYAYMKSGNRGQTSEVDKLGKECGLVVKKSGSGMPFWTYAQFPGELRKDAPDVLFMPIQAVPFVVKPKNMRLVVTVHDVAYLLFPEHFTPIKRILLDFHTKRAIRMADAIIVPSMATKNDIIKHYAASADKITVIYHGTFKSRESSPVDENISKVVESYRPYILFIGSIQPRKNISALIYAFNKIKSARQSSLKLVICGPKGWMHEKTFETAKTSPFSEDIIFTGNVIKDQLNCLYERAMIFAMPSLYEGFGLPVIEAMSCGLPCVVSRNSSLAEIGKDAALFFDPYDVSDIAKKIALFLDDEKLRAEYSQKSFERAKFFNWEKAAKMHLDVFEAR
ncbi:MAG: glycosyltransferase family 1 protein [Candidatus Paceibacterota bacterium]|jgi:glycosyltransferase involved in cell wall biosynthesis